MKQIFVPLLIVTAINLVNAQDSTQMSQRRNSIKLDLTSPLIYRNSFIVSYERITKPNQSFAVTAGYQQFPEASILGPDVSVKVDRKKSGYKYGGEYRFYLRKENKYLAPRGVYIGPYFTYHSFKNERGIVVDNNGTNEQAELNTKLNIFNVGFQLGYQFVIKNRWTIDLVFAGPSISHYRYTANLSGSFTFDKEDITNEILLDLIDRFPLLDDLVSDGEVKQKGKLDTWSFGYRYQLHVGYHFGRKGKK